MELGALGEGDGCFGKVGKVNRYQQRFKSIQEKFWEKVTKSDGCWIWNAGKDHDDYGLFRLGKEQRAHRVSWILAFGPIPKGKWVLHECDNPPCVRPSHLFLGNAALNNADKILKGRANAPVGERASFAKLTTQQVLEIRARHAAGETQRVIAKDFNVGFKAINKIVLRQRWAHV